MKEKPQAKEHLYNFSNRDLLRHSIKFVWSEKEISDFAFLKEISIRAENDAKKITKKADKILQSIYQENQELVGNLTEEEKNRLSYLLPEMIKKRNRSKAGFIGWLGRRGYLKSEYVNSEGVIDIERLKNADYFRNNSHLLDVLKGYELSKRSKLRMEIEKKGEKKEEEKIEVLAVSHGFDSQLKINSLNSDLWSRWSGKNMVDVPQSSLSVLERLKRPDKLSKEDKRDIIATSSLAVVCTLIGISVASVFSGEAISSDVSKPEPKPTPISISSLTLPNTENTPSETSYIRKLTPEEQKKLVSDATKRAKADSLIDKDNEDSHTVRTVPIQSDRGQQNNISEIKESVEISSSREGSYDLKNDLNLEGDVKLTDTSDISVTTLPKSGGFSIKYLLSAGTIFFGSGLALRKKLRR